VAAADGRAFARARWLHLVLAAGVALAAVIALVAAGDTGLERQDTLRSGAASLLLLGGIAVALYLGGTAFARDARSGYLGLMVGSGATPSQVGAGRLLVRAATLVVVLVVWGLALQGGSLALGEGLDAPLALHTLGNLVNTGLILCATAAMASVIGPVAAGAFGAIVFVSAQAAVNLKAALDQGAVDQDSSSVVEPVYAVFPRAIVSPMIRDLQERDAGGPAAPRLDVNGVDVLVPSSPPLNWVWTLLWVSALAAVAVVGVRRRQL
jgi:hypothetical protein